MQYSDFRGQKISKLGLGCMRLPGTKGLGFGHIIRKKALPIVDMALECGINYFDTAHVYGMGDSERFTGQALSRHPRDSYHLATKYNILGGGPMRRQFEHQLKRLKTDYIDFYLVHCVMDSNVDLYINGGVAEFFAEERRKGNIRYLGFSSHASPEVVTRYASVLDWDFAQVQLNYYDWVFERAKDLYEVLTSRGIPIFVMEPVRGGKLASLGKSADALLKRYEPSMSIASWAFRFLMTLPNVVCTLSGMSNLRQLQDNVRTFEEAEPLSDQLVNVLFSACESLKAKMAMPCTACRYCTDSCPKAIDIPQFLDAYNELESSGRDAAKQKLAGIKSKGRESDCVSCHACERHCPQGLKIASAMESLSAL